jgi:hypothetical protein
MTEDELELEAAGYFLVEVDEEFDVDKQLHLLHEAQDNETNVPGVQLWEPFETWPAKDVLYEIESLKQLLTRVYEKGRESK